MIPEIPDLEAWIVSQVPEASAVWQYASTAPPPYVWEDAEVQVDVKAPSKEACRVLAYTVRDKLLALPETPWPGGIVSRVLIVTGPAWLPEPDGSPKYVVRVAVTVHAARPVSIGG